MWVSNTWAILTQVDRAKMENPVYVTLRVDVERDRAVVHQVGTVAE
jgi:hypothetical protein